MPEKKNRIKQFRHAKGLSQRALADLCGISQQHLQRLEVEVSPIRLELAIRLSDALQASIEAVFPALSPVLTKFPGKKLKSNDACQALETAGVELEGVVWVAKFGLRGGCAVDFTLSSADQRRLDANLTDFEDEPMSRFFWFHSERYSVVVNLMHTVYFRLMFHSPGIPLHPEESMVEGAPSILVWMNGQQESLSFQSVPDEPEPDDDDDEDNDGFGQLQQMLIELDGGMSNEGGFVSFMDDDGEWVYLRVADIAMIAVPHWLLKPEILDEDETDEPEDEESSTPVTAEDPGTTPIQ
jgi:DNA-binding XRE family transcriptional regulator